MPMAHLDDIAHERLADTDLTVHDLLTLVEQIVAERLATAHQTTPSSPVGDMMDWWQSMISEIIVPNPGTPAAHDLLREERDQWYKPS